MKPVADSEAERDFIQNVLGLGEESPGRLNAELAQQTISKECFTGKWYWEIYSAAKDISRSGTSLDASTIAASIGPESRECVFGIWPAVPQFGSIRVIGQKLNDYRVRRAASEIGRRIVSEANAVGSNFSEGLIRAAAALQASFSSDGGGIETGEDVLLRFYDALEKAQGIGCASVIPTGIRPMDDVIGGLPTGFLSIIGAYPGCFKSGIMATIAANLAHAGKKVGFFSLEDNPTWVAKRYVSRATGIAVQDLARRKLRKDEMQRIGEKQDDIINIVKNIYFDGRSGLSGFDVAASARFMIADKGCQVIIVDHIGEMKASHMRRDRYDLEVAENVRAVRDVAKDTGCAVLMAAHLRRRQDSEEDIHRVPKLTDFSDSSSIEKMTRLALGLWQPPESQDQVAMKVLKQNEGGARGTVFHLSKDPGSALVLNG